MSVVVYGVVLVLDEAQKFGELFFAAANLRQNYSSRR